MAYGLRVSSPRAELMGIGVSRAAEDTQVCKSESSSQSPAARSDSPFEKGSNVGDGTIDGQAVPAVDDRVLLRAQAPDQVACCFRGGFALAESRRKSPMIGSSVMRMTRQARPVLTITGPVARAAASSA